MTRRVPLAILLLSSVAPLPLLAQQTASTAATAAQSIDDLPEDEAEGEEIVVQGQRPRGSVIGDIPPENQLDSRDIRATGATSISELLDAGVQGETYAHEQVHVPMGTSREFLEIVAEEAIPVYDEFGWKLCGAWETAMVNESECFLHWAIPTRESWAETEHAERRDSALQRWRNRTYELTEKWHRFLVVDAPLSPMRIGRQPARSDRDEGWEDL